MRPMSIHVSVSSARNCGVESTFAPSSSVPSNLVLSSHTPLQLQVWSLLCVILALLLSAQTHAQGVKQSGVKPADSPSGYSEEVIYSFASSSGLAGGIEPRSGLIQDAAGNFYGTTTEGGSNGFGSNCPAGVSGCGTVFKLSAAGQETVLYSFCSLANCADGEFPYGGVILDAAGNLYGTTTQGGANGGGTVFKLDSAGTETVLYSFCSQGGTNCTDGTVPYASLVRDSAGNLYGTTSGGGTGNIGSEEAGGTVFKVDGAGTETVLHSFCSSVNCADGDLPYAGLIIDAAGNLFGTTVQGGDESSGTVFKVDTTGQESVLYSFGNSVGDGGGPYGGLIEDAAGNFYGTTAAGPIPGAGSNCPSGYGCGTVFKLNAANQLTVLYDFCSESNCADGYQPWDGLVQDAAGNLYGTTFAGGANSDGIAFKVDNTGSETVLYNFCSDSGAIKCSDGVLVYTGLLQDTAGNLYGTTYAGGAKGAGTVFELTTGPILLTPTVTVTPSATSITTTQGLTVAVDVGGTPTPTGTVTLSGGGYSSAAQTLVSGAVSFNIPAGSLAVGSDTLTATYTPDSASSTTYRTASGTGVVAVAATATTTIVTSSANPQIVGLPLTITATVTPASGSGVPTGDAVFSVDDKAGAVIPLTNGVANATLESFPPGTFSAGTHTIVVTYSPAAGSLFAPSIGTLTQTITASSSIATTTTLTSSKNPQTAGLPVTFTVTVTPASGTVTPTGTVTTTVDGATGPTLVLANGTASITTSVLTAGTHTIVATYVPDSNSSDYLASSATLIQTIKAARVAGTLTLPTQGTTLSPSNVTFTWTTGTGNTGYALWLGVAGPGSSDVYASAVTSAHSVVVPTIPARGLTIYARLFSEGTGGSLYNDYSFTEPTSAPAALISPAAGSVLGASNVTFTWSAGTAVSEYILLLGASGPGSSSLYSSGALTTTSVTVPSLPAHGATVYARLFSIGSGGEQYSDYTFTEGTMAPATLTSPTPGSVLGASNVTFTWTAGTYVREYVLWLGVAGPGSSDLYSSGAITTTSTTVPSLPAHGAKIYARLFSIGSGGESSNDYTFTEP